MKFSEKEIFFGIGFLIILGGLAIALIFNIYIITPEYCGDGVCQNDEIYNCVLDCDWCGDGYCQIGETCSSCSKDCGNCEGKSYCGDGICNVGECDIGCFKDCSFTQCQNGICEPEKGENCIVAPNDCSCSFNEVCDSNSKKCIKVNCGNNVCDKGETLLNCPNDCKEEYVPEEIDPNIDYPIILVHGHNPGDLEDPQYSLETLNQLQNQLSKDGYQNKGVLLPSAKKTDLEQGLWGKLGKPVVIRTTYYLGVYDEFGSRVGNEDEQSIYTYAERLGNVVEAIKHYTGKNKVIIIAHSMGGLVSRAYIKHKGGAGSVDKLIMIGTPNHGIPESFSILCKFIPIFSHPGPNCAEMTIGSNFLNKLNYPDETYGSVKYYTIAANIGTDSAGYTHDGVIRISSTKLQGAIENYVIDATDESFGTGGAHTPLTIHSQMPESYNKIKSII